MTASRTPTDGNWPCQTTPDTGLPPRLVAALYVLMRDHVHPGDLEQVAIHVTAHTEPAAFTNPHLEAYARALATHLTTDECACRSFHARTGRHADMCPLYEHKAPLHKPED